MALVLSALAASCLQPLSVAAQGDPAIENEEEAASSGAVASASPAPPSRVPGQSAASPAAAPAPLERQTDAPTKPRTPEPLPITPFEVTLNSPVISKGLLVRAAGRKIVIGPGECQVNGKTISFPNATKVIVPAPPYLKVLDDPVRFTADGLTASTVVLPHCYAARGDSVVLKGILVSNSVKLKSQPGEGGFPYQPWVDFAANPALGAVKRNPKGRIKPGEKLYADYFCYKRRLDTITLDPREGKLLLIQGIPARSAPEPPHVEAPLIPLANVYSASNDQPFKPGDIMPISAIAPLERAAQLKQHNLLALAPVIKKLNGGENVHIAFWGDGVTWGFDARTRDEAFPYSFIKTLRRRYPKAKIVASNLGMPFSDSSTRIAQLDNEVLAIKPDLIIVEFMDDIALPASMLEDVYERFLDKTKAAGVRVILCTPHYPSPRAAKAGSWSYLQDKAYPLILRELAQKNDEAALADVSYRWQNLDKEGLRPDILLVNELNYPNSKGHSIYVEELLRCFGINDFSSP